MAVPLSVVVRVSPRDGAVLSTCVTRVRSKKLEQTRCKVDQFPLKLQLELIRNTKLRLQLFRTNSIIAAVAYPIFFDKFC